MNDQVHGAAVNDFAFRTRVAGGSRATPCYAALGAMMIDNSDRMIEARKMICQTLHTVTMQFAGVLDHDDKLLQALLFCGAANRDGGTSEDEIKRLHSWFHESVKRATVLAEYLTGRCDVEISEDGEVSLAITDVVREYVGGDEASADDAIAVLETKGEWCGGHVSAA